MKRIHFKGFRNRASVRSRGQAALETAFVFTGIIFLTFFGVNLAAYMHVKFVATYASFMAARSYQVYGDQTGREAFRESIGASEQELLDDLQALATIRTAEDIFTCALPWVRPPNSDVIGSGDNQRRGCMSGQRRYQDTNVNRRLTFISFDNPDAANQNTGGNLLAVNDGYAENGRFPVRYAILRLQYKNNLIINPYNVFDGDTLDGRQVSDFDRRRLWSREYVPVVLNPGLESGVRRADPQENTNVDERVAREAQDEN